MSKGEFVNPVDGSGVVYEEVGGVQYKAAYASPAGRSAAVADLYAATASARLSRLEARLNELEWVAAAAFGAALAALLTSILP